MFGFHFFVVRPHPLPLPRHRRLRSNDQQAHEEGFRIFPFCTVCRGFRGKRRSGRQKHELHCTQPAAVRPGTITSNRAQKCPYPARRDSQTVEYRQTGVVIKYTQRVSRCKAGQLNAKYRYVRVSILKRIDSSIYRRCFPALFLSPGLISVHNINVSPRYYRYSDISI